MGVRFPPRALAFRLKLVYYAVMKTNRYVYAVMLQVEVEAFDEDDAASRIEDCFGEGDQCGLMIQSVEVLDFEALT